MFDQSFSAENFRRIFDYENRKGNYLEGRYFPDVESLTKKIKGIAGDIKNLRKKRQTIKPEDYLKKREKLKDNRSNLEAEKEELLTTHLTAISQEVSAGKHKFNLVAVSNAPEKATYSVSASAHDFFVAKQLQINIRKLYKVKQSNRFEILCQLKSVLGDEFPKAILRTDLRNFYETIETKHLMRQIESEALLSQTSKKYIRQIISQYHQVTGTARGLPRGVGISAYLAELYARSLDKKLLDCDEVVYYARYVDDIILVLISSTRIHKLKILKRIESAANLLGLSINSSKTSFLEFPKDIGKSFIYLGFKIQPASDGPTLSFPPTKLRKYNHKIRGTFEDYLKRARTNEKKARKLLVKRVRFLTGNSRLFHNKRDALVGIYFSNRMLNDLDSLAQLDKHLSYRKAMIGSPEIASRLESLSFTEGFTQRRFFKFTPEEFTNIVKLWKHAT